MGSRIVNVTISGREWPMCLTLSAYIRICERYGGLQICVDRLTEMVTKSDMLGLCEEHTWLADQLMSAAYTASGEDPANCPPNQEDLKNLLCPGDLPDIQSAVLECLRIGQYREVGVEAPKNEDGAEAAE